VRRLLSLLLVASLAFFAIACGSTAKARGAKGRSEAKVGSAHLLALAIGQAKRMRDPNPSLIGIESSGRSASLVVGTRSCGRAAAAATCRLATPIDYRARVDLKTGKARVFVPQSPPVVTGRTKVARALVQRSAVNLGMDSRVRISLVDARWHRRTPAIAVVYRGGAGTTESNWREELAAIRSSEPPEVPVVSYSNSNTSGGIHSRQPFGGAESRGQTASLLATSKTRFPQEGDCSRRAQWRAHNLACALRIGQPGPVHHDRDRLAGALSQARSRGGVNGHPDGQADA
jgi:hypothetical protein